MLKNKKNYYQTKNINCESKKNIIRKKCPNGGEDDTGRDYLISELGSSFCICSSYFAADIFKSRKVMKICGNMESGLNIQLLQRANSYRNIKKRKLIWLDVKSGRPKCLIMSWENHNRSNIFGSLNFTIQNALK